MFESRLSLTVDSRTGERSLKRFRSELNDVERAGGRATRSADQFSGSLSNIKVVALAAAGALSALGIAQLTRNVYGTIESTERLQASLKTVTGSLDDANDAWATLVDFAATTPFTLDQSVTGFIRMKSLGLDPTTEALNSFGNTASAMGKDLMQMIEAVADASTGEFERLKEFGIRAKSEGDNIRFIFQGTEQVVRNNAAAITGYLEEIGNTAFSGAMAEQMDTVGGQMSNLEDQVDAFYRAIGDAGATDAFKGAISSTADVVAGLTENMDSIATGVKAAAFAAGGAATAYGALAVATRGATIAQTAFNIAARANPYVFLATTAAAAAGAIYSLNESFDPAIERAEKLKASIGDLTENLDLLTRAELENRKISFAEDMLEATTEAEKLAAKLTTVQEKIRNSGQLTPQGGALPIATAEDLQRARDLSSRIDELTLSADSSKGAIAETEKLIASLGKSAEDAAGSGSGGSSGSGGVSGLSASVDELGRAWYRAQQSAYESFQLLMDDIDPVGAELRSLGADIAVVQEAFARGFISAEQADTIVNELNNIPDKAEETGETSGQNFSRGFESQVDRVADSLQNSITSGDWAGIGATIGASLASGVAQVVGDQVSGSLGAGIASAIGGPIVGAIAGGVVGLAAQKIADFFSDDWDPTEMRQAAQGTGTVLADMNAKSESIRRAVEGSESGIGQLVGINQNMLRALQTLQLGISGAVGMVARQRSGMEFNTSNQFSQAQLAAGVGFGGVTAGSFGPAFGLGAGAFDLVDDALGGILSDGVEFLDNLTGGLLSSIGSSVFGGDQKVVDEGIRIIGGNLSDLVNRTLVQAYATIKEDGGWFSSDKRFDRFQNIATNQFSLAFGSIYDALEASAGALGIDASRRLNNLSIDTQRISLENLSPEEQQAELEAVFSTIFDRAAGAAVPFIDEFQRAGEGLGETLARVANQTLVTEEAVTRLGIQFTDLSGRQLVVASERLMEAAGGVEQFISSMEGFIDNFASDAQQFALAQSDITRALSQSNLQLPATRDGYYDLLQAQNGATAAGADNIATLLRLQGVADEYYTFLEDANRSAIESQRDLLSVQQSTYRDALQEAEAMAGSVSRALDGLSLTGQQFDAASRERALASLDRMASTGQIGSQSALDDALASATDINAGDFGTLNDYIRTVARTGATLTNLQQVTDRQVTREQKLLANIERRIEAMTRELGEIGRSSAKSNLKTAKILERIELDGLEVRE